MNPERILLMANLSLITYSEPEEAEPMFKQHGYDIVKYFNEKGAQSYLIKNKDELVLCFRGTEPKQKSDIFADLNTFYDPAETVGRVHEGFKGEVDKVWPLITKALDKNKKPLAITGHSLGAAMSTIAASRLQDKQSITGLYTFGSPRVGNQAFINNIKVEHWRCKNTNDVVTSVPPRLLGFRHHGNLVYLNYFGWIRPLSGWQLVKDQLRARWRAIKKWQLFSGAYDHSMTNYIKKLDNVVSNPDPKA